MATADDVIKEIEEIKKLLLKENREELNEFNLEGLTAVNTADIKEFLALAAGAGLGDPIRDKIAGFAGGFGGMLAGTTGKAIAGAGIAMFLGKNNRLAKLFGQGMLIDAVGDYIKEFAGQFLK